MIDSEKNEFFSMLKSLVNLPLLKAPKNVSPEMARMYWVALKHRTLSEVGVALNRHIQDPDRGRFFPLPADVAAQLPQEADAWLTADEAWATCPKDESASAAMCDEIAASLSIAKDLIDAGDMIAARRSFIDHYNRLVDEAKRENRKPHWWASLGHDKDGRHKAKVEIVERNNLMIPSSERLALPDPEDNSAISMKKLVSSIPKKHASQEKIKSHISNMRKKLGLVY